MGAINLAHLSGGRIRHDEEVADHTGRRFDRSHGATQARPVVARKIGPADSRRLR